MSYLDQVLANASSVTDNIIVYMNTGSSSVSEGKKPVKDSESVPLSEQDISEQDKSDVNQDISEQDESDVNQDIDEIALKRNVPQDSKYKNSNLEDRFMDMTANNIELDSDYYFSDLTPTDFTRLRPYMEFHCSKHEICSTKGRDNKDSKLFR
jgi:hypothetical protein